MVDKNGEWKSKLTLFTLNWWRSSSELTRSQLWMLHEWVTGGGEGRGGGGGGGRQGIGFHFIPKRFIVAAVRLIKIDESATKASGLGWARDGKRDLHLICISFASHLHINPHKFLFFFLLPCRVPAILRNDDPSRLDQLDRNLDRILCNQLFSLRHFICCCCCCCCWTLSQHFLLFLCLKWFSVERRPQWNDLIGVIEFFVIVSFFMAFFFFPPPPTFRQRFDYSSIQFWGNFQAALLQWIYRIIQW